MRFVVLGSGSGGNATVVEREGQAFLIDAGLSARQLVNRLREVGIAPEDLRGILITHEHGDHVRGLEVFLRKFPIPVYVTALTQEVLQSKTSYQAEWKLFQAGQSFEVAGMEVTSFSIPHDAVDPIGFRVSFEDAQLGVLTDLGYVTPQVRRCLEGVRALVLEANYCERMLEEDPNRPWSLKQRISSRHGHLSNRQAVDFVRELQDFGLERVILGHLSRDCNQAAVAEKEFEEVVLQELRVASQHEPTPWIQVVPPKPVTKKGGQMEFGSFLPTT